MSACVVEEGREEGGGACLTEMVNDDSVVAEPSRREVLMSARGRRACSEQGPHPGLGYMREYCLLRYAVIYVL